jgi:NitT/TauT family transport system substrate-binding protein
MRTLLTVLMGGLLLAALAGCGNNDGGSPKGLPPLSFHTSGLATTPQMALWRVISSGALPELADLRVEYWKNLDDLRGLLLAGKGDIWLGHTEGFAQAALRGAPVRLLAVTSWRKFSILTRRPGVATVDDLAGPGGPKDARIRVAVAPPQSPALPVLRELEKHGLPRLAYAPHEPRQAMLEAINGDLDTLLLPEPLATVLLNRDPRFRILVQLEDLYGELTGHEPLLPMAGVAVHARLAKERPAFVSALRDAVLAAGAEIAADPDLGVAALPEAFEKFVDKPTVRRSLGRDRLLARSAGESRAAVLRYLAMVLPEAVKADGTSNLPDGFFWN